MAYAADTSVSVEKSRAEIERLVVGKHKCQQFMTGMDFEKRRAKVQFKSHERFVLFEIDLPDPNDRAYTRFGRGMSQSKFEQAERQRWRALLLVIKAKLEAVESKITTFEEEFLAHIVLPNQQTVAQYILPAVKASYQTGIMPEIVPPERQLGDGKG